jgi:hypothetical protein
MKSKKCQTSCCLTCGMGKHAACDVDADNALIMTMIMLRINGDSKCIIKTQSYNKEKQIMENSSEALNDC